MGFAPIVLFVYNRPKHALRTLEALAANEFAKESDLYVFADGAKENADEETVKKIMETRKVAASRDWCKSTTLIVSEKNKGLARSIIEGVTEVVKKHGKIIVLEDDLMTSPFFLKYMNEGLDLYANDSSVACLSGYIYPVKGKMPETFFLKGADCWGWATWDRAWNEFESDGSKLLKEIKEKALEKEFDFGNTYPYVEMLEHQILGKNDSWAVRWYAAAFLKNRYCLYPGTSLVQNTGMDGSGTHTGNSDKWKVELASSAPQVKKIEVENNKAAYAAFKAYFRTLQPSTKTRIKNFVKKLIR